MSWNYRMLSEVVGDATVYYIAEVYYDADGKPKSWSERDFNPVSGWDDLEDLKGTIVQLQRAAELPLLRVMGETLEEWQ